MQNNYILKKDNDLLSFYYGAERAIYCSKLGTNNSYIVNKIIEDVTDYFTVSVDQKGDIYIFCQASNGDVILCKLEENSSKNKTIFKNKNEISHSSLFYPIFLKGNMSLIYNIPSQNGKENLISIKTLIGGKSWTNVENIDTFTPFGNKLFYVQRLNDDDFVLVYQKIARDIQIGCKEVRNGSIQEFLPFHKTGYQIVDYSFIAFNNSIHFIYIVKSMFSNQVVYRRKDENGLSNPIVLFEGQKIKSCSICILDNILYCKFISSSVLYYSSSKDFGLSFSGVVQYRRNLTQDVTKARFVSNVDMRRNCMNEIYIDSKNTLNIQFIPEFAPEIFKSNIYNREENDKNNTDYTESNNFISNLNNQLLQLDIDNQSTQKHENENTEQRDTNYKRVVPIENDFMANFNLSQFDTFRIDSSSFSSNSELARNSEPKFEENFGVSATSDFQNSPILENRLQILSEQLKEKNTQILQLNSIIQNKNNEKTDIEIALRQKIKRMEEENRAIKEETNKLMDKINSIEQKTSKKNVKSKKESEKEPESEVIEQDEEFVQQSEEKS